ncbi:MAG: type II toxin-antitoxin system PemK/MazF family toxin [Firmicutes bacterium]|nr:type II toxin-antitoxin system PemK/MazF family toxin [Bacillota bacterium]
MRSVVGERTVAAGDVLLMALPFHTPKGHEQEGKRPVIVVGCPSGTLRYPTLIVVPLTTQVGRWARQNPTMYPSLSPGEGGLPRSSVALLDQLRSIDVRRIEGYLGTLRQDTLNRIRAGIMRLFEP